MRETTGRPERGWGLPWGWGGAVGQGLSPAARVVMDEQPCANHGAPTPALVPCGCAQRLGSSGTWTCSGTGQLRGSYTPVCAPAVKSPQAQEHQQLQHHSCHLCLSLLLLATALPSKTDVCLQGSERFLQQSQLE